MSVLVVTGTGPGVGKTMVAAALASTARAKRGQQVAVVKPAQTAAAAGASADLATVTRLAGVTDVHEYVRYPDSLSPHHAAAAAGLPELDLASVVRRIVDLDATRDTVVVEGTGGLLVPFTSDDRWTLADLAAALHAPVLVVTGTGPAAPNHAALTVDRLAEDGIHLAGVVIGRWPAEPDRATRLDVADLAALGPDGRLAGALPDGLGVLTATEFGRAARTALAPVFGGRFDPVRFAAQSAG